MSSPGFSYGHPSALSWAAPPSYNLTALSRGLWGYYLFEEPSGAVWADSSGRGHDLAITGTLARAAGNSTPFAADLDGSVSAETPNRQMDGLVDPWGFVIGLYLTTPAANAAVLMHSDEIHCGLSVLWNGDDGGSDLCFRMQTGYRAGHDGEAGYEYRNDIVIPNLTAPIDDWFFVAGSFRGPSISAGGGPVTETLMTLRVNDTVNSVAAMALDSVNPPEHEVLSAPWILGTSFIGRIGPLGIYDRALSDGEMEILYNDGDWLDLF